MSSLWPHLPEVIASRLYSELHAGQLLPPAVSIEGQVWAAVGSRVDAHSIEGLRECLLLIASQHGFPTAAGPDARVAFDRAAAPLLSRSINIDWAEAGHREVWSFLALVLLPDLTYWRFGSSNRERWVASDLTRHTWGRLWWQAKVFGSRQDLLDRLTESDLNQLLERRSIGGDPRLVRALASAVVGAPGDVGRRELIRQSSLRLLRWLAFVDVRSLDNEQLERFCLELTAETYSRVRQAAPSGAAAR
jgi:hypothetical protein